MILQEEPTGGLALAWLALCSPITAQALRCLAWHPERRGDMVDNEDVIDGPIEPGTP